MVCAKSQHSCNLVLERIHSHSEISGYRMVYPGSRSTHVVGCEPNSGSAGIWRKEGLATSTFSYADLYSGLSAHATK
jgi:hypothetical protein